MSRYPISGTCIFSSRIWIPSAHGVLLRQQFLFSERKKCIPRGTIRDYQQISTILSNSSGARRTVDFPTLVTFYKSRYRWRFLYSVFKGGTPAYIVVWEKCWKKSFFDFSPNHQKWISRHQSSSENKILHKKRFFLRDRDVRKHWKESRPLIFTISRISVMATAATPESLQCGRDSLCGKN